MTGRDRRPVLVHDFFVQDGGAERCALEFARLLPTARIETSFFDAARFGDRLDPRRVRTWPVQRLTGPTARFRSFLPLYPAWFTALDLREAPLVLSSSIAFSHAVRTSPGSPHVSYVYTPMRYAWDLDTYLDQSSYSTAARLAARTVRPLLRRWDRATAGRPDLVVAISETVRDRIDRVWGRSSQVIYPPVDTDQFTPTASSDGYYLVAARLLAYRRVDLAVGAATALGRELVVVGDGPERRRLESMAGPTVRFLGHLPRARLVELFHRCRAYVVPGVEDFGIAPVEAMAAGKPVIAFAGGGALETVVEGETGTFFRDRTVASAAEAFERLEAMPLDMEAIRARADRFDTTVFRAAWRELLDGLGLDPELYSTR